MTGREELELLLERRNQRFICSAAGADPGPKRFTALLRHDVTAPAPASVLETLLQRLRNVPQVAAFYERYGSVELYCDTVGVDSAFRIANPDEWSSIREEFTEWLDMLDPDEAQELLPDWIDNYIAIGRVPGAASYFLVPMAGDFMGHVFEFDHDGFEFTHRGDFDAFLGYLATVDARLLRDILAHTRYSDGETDAQWMPLEYKFDD